MNTHFICGKCKYVTSIKEELNKHVKDIHTEDSSNVHICNDCTFVARSKENLNNHVKIHRILGKKCDQCDQAFNNQEDLELHKVQSHAQAIHEPCQNKCKEYERLLIEHNLLKENYERLITINKKHQDQNKDKELAQNIQMEELRRGFEKAKAENIKLQDNLDTQNKLWKIWIEKMDDNVGVAENKSTKLDLNQPSDDEVLLIEDEDQDNVDDTGDEITDEIFKRFMINAAKTRFKRTSPTEEPVLSQSTIYKCTKCGFKANNNGKLGEHIKNVHGQRLTPVPVPSRQTIATSGKKRQFCHFWNNFKSCHFEAKNGRPCKFLHDKAPICRFDGNCDRKMCMFTHKSQNMNFLSNPPTHVQYPVPQRSQWGPPSPWMNQQNQNLSPWEGVKNVRWGNNRQF